jgi:transposase
MGVVGIDVSKATLDVVWLDEQHQTHYVQVKNSRAGYEQLDQWLKRRAVEAVCLEATGRYSEGIAAHLAGAGYRVSVVNPARIKGYARAQLRRNKTDKLDAALIADFCRTQQPAAWTPPSAEVNELQALVRHLTALETARQQVGNRLREATSAPSLVRAQLEGQRDLLAQQLQQLQRAIQDHIDQHPDLKRQRDLMDSIPGIGPLTAAKLLAECRSLTRFDDVRQLVAFAGLNPAHHDSGSSIHHKATISKTGNAAIRAALYMPAVVAKRYNPRLRAFAQHLLDRGLCQMQVLVAVMRKLLHLIFGILKSGRPFDPNFQPVS